MVALNDSDSNCVSDLRRDGVKVEQYSDGRMFGQLVTTKNLVQGEELLYMFSFSHLKLGHYSLEAWLATNSPIANHHAVTTFDVS